MNSFKTYVKPETSFIIPRCTLLELIMPVHETFVDDEAANKGVFYGDEEGDEYDSFFEE